MRTAQSIQLHWPSAAKPSLVAIAPMRHLARLTWLLEKPARWRPGRCRGSIEVLRPKMRGASGRIRGVSRLALRGVARIVRVCTRPAVLVVTGSSDHSIRGPLPRFSIA